MTVQSQISKIIYSGNGSTTVFSSSFFFTNNDDVYVILVSSLGIETPLFLTTHYTISGGGGANGNITMLTAPAIGEKLVIYRSPPLTQNTDYVENDAFPANSHENALDKLTQIAQASQEAVARSLKLPISSNVSPLLPPPASSNALAWNDTATALINVPLSDVVNTFGGKTFKDFGVVGDGIADDTVALSNALNSGNTIFCNNEIIKFSKVTSNQPVKLNGKVTLQHDGSAITGTSALVFNNTVHANHLIVRGNSTDTVYDLMQTNAPVYIETLELQSNTEQGGRGGYTNKSSDVIIEKLITKNIARPFVSETTSGYLSNIHVGDVIIDTYIRGIKFDKCTEFSVGSVFEKNRWSDATASPGQNGVLLEDCNNFKIGNCYIANSAEHAFRIGGAGGGVYGGTIGDIISIDSGGCAFKSNVDPTILARSLSIGNIAGVNCGEGSSLGNKEVVRLTRVRNVQIGQILGSISVTTGLILADTDNLIVAGLNLSNVNGRCIKFDETQDTSDSIIRDVYIGCVTGDCNNIRALIEFDYGGVGRTVQNVVIDNVNAVGYTDYLVTMAGGCNINGVIKVSASVPTTLTVPLTESPVNDSRYIVDIDYGGRKYIGRGDLAVFTGALNTEAGGTLDLSGTPSNFGGVMSQNIGASSNNGAYGGSFICGRAGSARRAAGIASKQIGANPYKQGLAFFVQDAVVTGTDLLTEAGVLKPNGILNLPLLPTYANEAAALAGGLVTGDLYKTATGELRFKL